MMQMSTGIQAMPPVALGMPQTVKTRFGEVVVDASRAVVFARGLLGMPDKLNFALASFPSEKMQQFTLLQSLDDHGLSFITLPLPVDNALIASTDIREACADLQIPLEQLLLLLVVSVHRGPSGVRLSVNVRAPLLVDVERKFGIQHVFQSDHYKVQHMLG